MPQYPTCSHIKEDGTFCRVAAVRDQKYCYYHLKERARSLRRARALRDNAPYRVEIPSLDNPYAVRNAITEIVQALGSGQLDPRVAGKMLYGIQLVRAENKRIAQIDAQPQPLGDPQLPSAANCENQPRIHELPDFEKQLGLPPGADLDTEIETTFKKADQAAQDRQTLPMPTPPPGVRPGSAAWRVYREECYQALQLEVKDLRFKLREYFEQKRQESLKDVEEAYRAAGLPIPASLRKPPASSVPAENKPESTGTA